MWEYFRAGGPLMWPLLACSIIALAVVMERCWFWTRLHFKKDEIISARILRDMKEGAPCSTKPDGILSAMLIAGCSALPGHSGKAMEVIALEALCRMRKGMSILDTIITAAPMLGIMGTVLGIITSFDMLGEAGISDPKAVIAGIAQALITTATGLGIAVFTIFPFNYFNFRIDNAQELMEIYGSRLEILKGEKPDAREGKNASSENP